MTDTVERPKLSDQLRKIGVDDATWIYVSKNMYPEQDVDTVLMYLRYCKARKFDPMKKPAHIVSFNERYVDDSGNWHSRSRCQVLPGVDEARITAHRTGQYIGQYPVELGPEIDAWGKKVPAWASVTVIRAMRLPDTDEVIQAEFTGVAFFTESCSTKFDKKEQLHVPNAMWSKRPISMLIKSAERLALVKAFPEEVGNMEVAEDMEGSTIEIDKPQDRPKTNLAGQTDIEGELDTGESKTQVQIEHQKGNDLDELLAVTRPELQPASVAAREGLEKVVNDRGIPGDKPMDGKTIDQEAKIEPEPKKKAKSKKKPPPTKEPDNKIPVDDPPSPEELVNVPSFAPLSTGPAKDEPPPYGELDLGGGK